MIAFYAKLKKQIFALSALLISKSTLYMRFSVSMMKSERDYLAQTIDKLNK